jgi:uncharacterized membrane protein YdjX (TVP38/TMEM64 family)
VTSPLATWCSPPRPSRLFYAAAVADQAGSQRVRRFQRLRRLVVVAAIVLVVVLAFTSGLVDHVSDEGRLQDTVDDAGVWGPLLFVGLMVLLVPLNVPGVLFVIPSTTLFGTAGGVALSLIGGFLASAVGVVASRHLGRGMFETRMPERVLRWEARLSARGFWGVVVLRCFTYLLQPADWLCGLSSMPLRSVLTATFVGLVPPTVVIALTGGGLLDLLG